MEQRGLCGTMLSTCRAPAVQVIPGHFIFLSSSPGTLFFYRHPRAMFFYCHPRASTRGSTLQSTILTMENNGATRPLWYNVVNLPRACRAGHPRALYFFIVIPGHFIFLSSSPGYVFLLSSPGFDPGIHPSKHNLDHGKQWSNAASVVQCCQPAARLPCRSSPASFLFLVIPGLQPGDPPFKAQS